MKLILSLLFLSLCLTSGAQTITYSAYEKFDLRSGDYSVIGKVDGHLYTYRSSSEGYFLDALDDSMQRVATVVLDFFPSKIYDTRFIAYPDKIIVLFQANERGKITQQAALLDGKGRLQGKVLQLDETKTGIFGPSGNYFSSVVSDDKKNIVVYATSTKGSALHITHTLLDDNLHILQRSESNYEGENSLTTLPALLDNKGTFFLPVTTNAGSRDYADGIWMLSLPKNSARIIEKELPLKTSYASGLYFKMDNSRERIYGGGFYSSKKAGNYEGVLFAQLGTDSAAQSIVRHLPLEDRLREESGRNKKRAFNDYQTRQLIIRNDGGFVLLAEDYYVNVRSAGLQPYGYYTSYYSPFIGSQNIREFHYGDILALSYNGEGNREWNSFIRKDQYSQEDGGVFSSYSFINTGGSLGCLYNDFDSRRSRITLAVVDGQGQIDTHALYAAGAADPDWLPRAGKQVSGHELVIPCLRRRQICFAKVVF